MIFDTHAHYDDEAFDVDREELLAALPAAGVGRVIDVGASVSSSLQALELAERVDYIYASVGVHPSETPELETAGLDWLRDAAARKKAVAIGEIGLDYHWDEPPRDLQQKWFRAQLELAMELDMPVIIHSRDAAQDTYDILRETAGDRVRAVLHCFSYEWEMAKRFLDLGYYIGIGGVLTYKNARKQKEVLAAMPTGRLLIETDCPYLPPVPHRGERNSSLFLPLVVSEMAAIRGVSCEEIERVTWDNACRFYGMEQEST